MYIQIIIENSHDPDVSALRSKNYQNMSQKNIY